MKRQPLVEAVHEDFKGVREVLGPFVDNWELITRLRFPNQEGERLVYAVTEEPEKQNHGWNTGGLPHEWNQGFTWYRAFRFFEPWPSWILNVSLNRNPQPGGPIGQVEDLHDMDLRLHQVGEAQVWYGDERAVVWEVLGEGKFRDYPTIATFWNTVEGDVQVGEYFTHDHDPAYPGGYEEFLASLGYEPSGYQSWWHKLKS